MSHDLNSGNSEMNTYSITFTDPSNNDNTILDISYQIFLN